MLTSKSLVGIIGTVTISEDNSAAQIIDIAEPVIQEFPAGKHVIDCRIISVARIYIEDIVAVDTVVGIGTVGEETGSVIEADQLALLGVDIVGLGFDILCQWSGGADQCIGLHTGFKEIPSIAGIIAFAFCPAQFIAVFVQDDIGAVSLGLEGIMVFAVDRIGSQYFIASNVNDDVFPGIVIAEIAAGTAAEGVRLSPLLEISLPVSS